MQDSCCMDALLCPDFDQARDLRGDRHARGVLLGQKRGVRLHRDFAANVALRRVGHGSGRLPLLPLELGVQGEQVDA